MMRCSRQAWMLHIVLGAILLFHALQTRSQAGVPTKPGPAPVPTPNLSVTLLDDRALQARVERLHAHLFTHFVHPEINLVYDYIAPPGAPNPWAHLPTPAEIKAGKPNTTGWGTGMEDCSINGGALLACLVDRHAVTGRPEHAAEARRIFDGLRRLGTVAPRKGFIARGVLPDGKSFYPNSSVDQVTLYVFAMWKYYHSAIASDEEKGQIRQIMHDVCARIEDDGFDILDATGKPALVSDVGVIRSDRSSRLLEIYRVGADVTGEQHWLDIYKEKAAENHDARLRDITSPARVDRLPWNSRQAVYGILQNQVSLLPLLDLETALPVKAAYLEAIRLDARIVEDRLFDFRKYTPAIHNDQYTLGGWREDKPARPANLEKEYGLVRNPCEALVVMLMARECNLAGAYPATESAKIYDQYLREACRELLSTYDFEKMRTFGFLYAEYAYWLAVRQGLLKYAAE